MKRLYVILYCLLFVGIYSFAQHFSFDSKYVKVGIMSNEWPSCMANNPNLRNLGTLQGISFDQNRIGKQVLDLLFQRDENGLHMDRLYEEALQNTTVEELEVALKDASAEAKDVLKREVAHQLLKNNYIITFRTEQTTKMNGSPKIKKYWNVYHVEIDDRIIEQAYLNWRNPSMYDQIHVPVKLVAQGKVPKNAKDENELIYDIAKKVPAFAVRGPVTSRFPFIASMGFDMGVKKASRIYLYRVKEDSNGDIYSNKVCTTRASEVTERTTRMHMISGSFPSTKKGDVAVLKDRHRSSISFWGQGSLGNDSRFGAQLQYEYLLNFSNNGIAQYAMLNIGTNRYSKEEQNVWWNSGNKEPVQPVLNNVEAQLGYGIGFNLLGRIEIVPYLMGGYQFSFVSDKSQLDRLVYWDNSKEEKYGWQTMPLTGQGFVAYAGAKLNINIWYPLQLSVGVDYNYTFGTDLLEKKGTASTVEIGNSFIFGSNSFQPIRDRHKLNRVNLYAGFRVHF